MFFYLSTSLAIVTHLPQRVAGGWQDRANLLAATHYGRIGMDCDQVLNFHLPLNFQWFEYLIHFFCFFIDLSYHIALHFTI